ncbi:AAA family ATPase [Planctomicrobium sp. SH664]|uniref:AAA family ATPase n=1 Tax=Planctomicrobium sp. SH664 TaxID=3448125 RepID=UPI003F5B4867
MTSPDTLSDAEQDQSAGSTETVYMEAGRGGIVRKEVTPDVIRGNSHLEALFARVNSLLGSASAADKEFFPHVPETLEQMGLNADDVQRLVLKFLLQKGSATGREISQQIKIPFGITFPLLKDWKNEQLVTYRSAGEMGDYVFAITESGRDRGRKFQEECSYYGAAPVGLPEYLKAMELQSIAGLEATEADLQEAFSDLLISEEMFEKLGPAINSGRGMFLFGEPGNGKTSIAERITRCFGDDVWIPRALGIDGDIIRLFDPGVHDEVRSETSGSSLFDLSGVDPRWIKIRRPTIVAGGELTMNELEVTQNPVTKICEAPLQLKSNCGTLVIDDFGRQTMPVDVLLNRWIVPLEKRYDFLNLPSGKKIQVPFDQLIIFSTNLEPKDLVDGAFLRRIPYKINVPNPSREHFRQLFNIMGPKLGLIMDDAAVEYLIEKHYIEAGRPFRNCQPRDLLLQIKNYCAYRGIPRRVTPEGFDFAVENYFSMM